MDELRLLALSGSLRNRSYNTAALQALKQLAPEGVSIRIGNIALVPLFNPDREDDAIPAVMALKRDLKVSHGLIIASPEYAHGVSGPLKNALDWLVSGEEFPSIPIMLINTSPRAHHALEALREILVTMAGNLVEDAFVSVPLLGSHLDTGGVLANQAIKEALHNGVHRFCEEIRKLNGP